MSDDPKDETAQELPTPAGFIENPVIIAYLPERAVAAGKYEVMICHPEGWDERHYGILLADIIRHLYNATSLSPKKIFTWLKRELKHPTSPATQVYKSSTPPGSTIN